MIGRCKDRATLTGYLWVPLGRQHDREDNPDTGERPRYRFSAVFETGALRGNSGHLSSAFTMLIKVVLTGVAIPYFLPNETKAPFI